MKLSGNRTVLALVLTGLAVLVPCAAWYLVGSRELQRQINELQAGALDEARDTATRLARQLSQRLGALLEAESNRSFSDYQQWLGSGATDPLIELYFSVNAASGRVDLPAAQFELQRYDQARDKHARTDEQLFLQRQLERGVASILPNVRGESRAPAAKQVAAEPGKAETLVGQLKWRTVYVANDPSLVALRDVTTPQGSFLQGFLVSAKGLSDFFKTAGMPAKLLPGAPAQISDAAVALGDEPWHVTVDVSAASQLARERTRDLRRTFLTIFTGGAAIATLAGLAVVWLVWRSEQLARQRSQFAASAAHELRTPLAGLRIYSDMLADGLGDPGKSKDYAQRVGAEADRLGRVVANVLSFTRLERGTLTAQPTTGDLAGVVRESVARQQPSLEAAGARLEIKIADDDPPVRFDRDAVAQILQNLLDNAEKHTRHAADRCITVSLKGGALTVRDHGPGIPNEVRRHLFEAFARGRDNEAPAGLGLGLVLVKALAEAQGARVSYADADGGGAQFTVIFYKPLT